MHEITECKWSFGTCMPAHCLSQNAIITEMSWRSHKMGLDKHWENETFKDFVSQGHQQHVFFFFIYIVAGLEFLVHQFKLNKKKIICF